MTSPAELFATYRPLAHRIASRYRSAGLDLDDIRQEACLGLWQACIRARPGQDFPSFARRRITGQIIDGMRQATYIGVRPGARIFRPVPVADLDPPAPGSRSWLVHPGSYLNGWIGKLRHFPGRLNLPELDEQEILERIARGEQQAALAREFGVSQQKISLLKKQQRASQP